MLNGQGRPNLGSSMFRRRNTLEMKRIRSKTSFRAIFGLLAIAFALTPPAHADAALGISHRIGSFTPDRPNNLVLELRITNRTNQNLENIRLELTNQEIQPDIDIYKVSGVLLPGQQTTVYWSLQTPISYSYIQSGAPLFFRAAAHTNNNELISFSIVSIAESH